MITPTPTQEEIQSRIYQRILNETLISAPLESSVVGVLVKIFAAEYRIIWDYIEELARQSKLWTATGPGLDDIGLLLGAPRKRESQSSTLGRARAVRFTNNSGSTITIPSGTRVWKDADPTIAFFTTENLTLLTGTSNEAHVVAAQSGASFNVGIKELTRHSYPSSQVSVVNILPIDSGEAEESDDSYRERLAQEFRRRNVLNPDNAVAMLRGVPGVKEVLMLDQKRGPGTFDAIIIPESYSIANSVVATCQSLINENVPVGISGKAKSPIYRQLDINISLRFNSTVGSRQESIRESVRSQITARINNLPVEDGNGVGTFYVSQLRALAIESDAAVIDATATLGLDGSPLSSDGAIRLKIGERIVLRGLSVQ
jgi:uncharacterized phage protein gp47/JayE